MKNEREKEIENVNGLNRKRRRRFRLDNRRQGSESQLTDQPQNENITISRPHGSKKTGGNPYLYPGVTYSKNITLSK